MSNLLRVLERQQKQREETRRRRAQEDREADEEEELLLAAAMCMMDQSRQHRRPRAPNVDRRRESRGKNLMKDYFIPNPLYPASKFRERYRMQPHLFQKIMHDICNYDTYFIQKHDAIGALGLIPEQKLTVALRMLAYGAFAEQVDEIARMGKSTVLECLNDLNVLGQSPVFDEVLRGHSPQVTYQINNTVYSGAYYLSDGIYPRWTTFVKTIPNPQSEKERNFASFQEGYRKDVERCFGILQARWAIIRGAARM
ncbi:unnamed protein product [Prunus armeniaca]